MASLAERVRKVRLLLVTLNDGYPTPRGSIETPSGVSEGRRVPCDDCRRSGWLRTRQGMRLCLVCDGRGWKLRTNEDAWDEYVALPTVEAAQLPVMPSAPPVDAILARLADEQAEREGRLDGLAYGWERARAAHERRGSYRELRRSLERLHDARPGWHRLVLAKLVYQEPRVFSPTAETVVVLGTGWIARDMRGPIRVPPWVMERARADEQRETIGALLSSGMTPRQVAKHLGISREALKRKLRAERRNIEAMPEPPMGRREAGSRLVRDPAHT